MSQPFFLAGELEMDITHVCNLRCDGCTHYSNYQFKGHVALTDARTWLTAWSKRLVPQQFAMLGGEPTIHPDLLGFLDLAAEVWPRTERVLVTNAFFADRHPGLVAKLKKTGTILEISAHSRREDYLAKFMPKAEALAEACEAAGVRYNIRNSLQFYRTYHGSGAQMRPFADGKPRESWESCTNKFCTTIHRGRLWKCPPIAMLGLAADKFGLHAVDEWRPYLAYQGLPVDASDADLIAFLRTEEEAICAMCPAKLSWHEKPPVL